MAAWGVAGCLGLGVVQVLLIVVGAMQEPSLVKTYLTSHLRWAHFTVCKYVPVEVT